MSALRPNAEPNVTPLIDVMLVLLILFMLVTPVAQRAIDAELPRPSASDAPPPGTPPVISVRVDAVDLDGRRFREMPEVEAQLRDILATRIDGTVFARADGEVSYGRMVAAMDAARGAGAERIGLLGSRSPHARSDAAAGPDE